jgi:hypothetical protein
MRKMLLLEKFGKFYGIDMQVYIQAVPCFKFPWEQLYCIVKTASVPSKSSFPGICLFVPRKFFIFSNPLSLPLTPSFDCLEWGSAIVVVKMIGYNIHQSSIHMHEIHACMTFLLNFH